MSASPAQLEIHQGSQPPSLVSLNNDLVKIGRATDNTIILQDDQVSGYHIEIRLEGTHYLLTDLRSTNGSRVNDIRLEPHKPHVLAHGDKISIGKTQLHFTHLTTTPTVVTPGMIVVETPLVGPIDLRNRQNLTIGRDTRNDTVIHHPAVSRFHAQIRRQNGSFILSDLHTTNGTFINGKEVTGEKVIKVNDTIRIGPCRFILNIDETLVEYNEEGKLQLDAVNLNKIVGKGTKILDNISLSIKAREFIVIAGVSGGGKSTLLDALNGFRPATSGSVLINNIDLYKNFNAYRNELGYVPQKDIIHTELTVEQVLNYAAQLRMPADTTRAERQQRVQEVLQDLGLTHRKDVLVKSLSGGQIKRVSIGVELLTKPSLFFLDEATSGLDPGTEGDLMQLLRKLADQGRTILLITHATENVTLCDLVVFMAAGGRVAYFGPPKEAPSYFGVSQFNEIYRLVENEKSPEYWQQRYLQSPQYQKYVLQRQQKLPTGQIPTPPNPSLQPQQPHQTRRVSSLRELMILSQRNLAILIQDKISLLLMLAIPLILGLLDFVTWKRHLFDLKSGDATQAVTMLFVTALIAVMVGSLATMREIVKEIDIYRRERMIGQQIIPYIFSKVGICILLALYQAGVFLFFKRLAIDLPTANEALGGIYITLFLASLGGMIMGLLVSAISPNQNFAPLLTILFLVPQIVFGGALLPISSLGVPGQLINQITITKWSFESLVTLNNLGRSMADDSCWQLTKDERKMLSSEEKKQRCQCLGETLFKSCNFPGIQGKYDPILEQPEPIKPTDPGPAPSNPMELEDYQKKVDDYKTAIEAWQKEYGQWKAKYEGTIKGGEATIEIFYDKYGSMFKVNVTLYWLILCLQMIVMLALILFLQKRKDTI